MRAVCAATIVEWLRISALIAQVVAPENRTLK